ncbi:MAG: hypothetical protein PVI30_06545 [Myxococcales bacterium]|jgi:hypothetical protein
MKNRAGNLALLVFAALLGGGLLVVLSARGPETSADGPLDVAAMPEGLARDVASLLDASAPALDPAPEREVYLAIRSGGRRLAHRWYPLKGDWRAAVAQAMPKLLAIARKKGGDIAELAGRVDAVEVCLPHDFEDAEVRKRGVLNTRLRGVKGVRYTHGEILRRLCPTRMIASNLSFERADRDFRRDHDLTMREHLERSRAEIFDAHQLLLTLGDEPRVIPMFRGNQVVPMDAVSREGTIALAEGMGRWLTHSLQPDGRMVYMYYPSSGRESSSNNMIRQFMASVALVRLSNYRDDPELAKAALRNYRYNLRKFYRDQGEVGVITFRNKAKLGSAALAALGIVEAPFRDELAEYERRLVAMTDSMLQPDGSFHTFYGSSRNDNHNFYPGEALLLWAHLMEKQPDPDRLRRFMRAFEYYRQWHRENTNPAFIPWHTQAYYMVWKQTKNEQLEDFVFEMNDFLCDFQQWDSARYPDERGRFFDPERRNFGPPHASSTGVYLEGLIDAYRLARDVGDERRAKRYREAMRRGIRSLMQVQFTDEVDTFYISNKDQVMGGVRTTVYNNVIRVDNVQHSLMGLMKLIPIFDHDGAW